MRARSGSLGCELHLGHARLGGPGGDGLALLLDGLVRDLEPGDDVGLVNLLATGLDHADGVLGARHNQVDRALVDLLIGGVDDPRPVDLGHPHGATGPVNGASERLRAAEAPVMASTS